MEYLNPVSIIIILLFILPPVIGLVSDFSRLKMRYSLSSLLDNIEFLVSLIVSVYLTRRIFFENSGTFFQNIYNFIPESIKSALNGRTMLTYACVTPFIMLLTLLLLRLFTSPFYRRIIVPVSDRLHGWVSSKGITARRIMGFIWQLPKSVYLPLLFVLFLNISTYFIYSPALSGWTNESRIYHTVYESAVAPIIDSDLINKIPVIADDSFRDFFRREAPAAAGTEEQSSQGMGRWDIKVIRYYNGVTLDEAIKSNDEIDGTAKKITAREKTDKGRAYAIYKWITGHVAYDYKKAEDIVKNTGNYSSGAITAYKTGKGICFDYSALYIAMSRAAGLKVRLVTGLGYSGVTWGDHAWNQVWSSEEKRWINVDTTFGSSGVNYFDRPRFTEDHTDAVIQGEW